MTETELLSARGLAAGYHGHAIVSDLNMTISSGQVVALLGPNGAGKTTTLLALAGDLPPLAGAVHFLDSPTTAPLHRRAKQGLGFVTEERSVFMRLSVRENLRAGRCDIDKALTFFPELAPLLARRAGVLSGGEQQMLTLARVLARDPKVLLIDELSLGLAPMIVRRLMDAVRDAAANGVGVLLVEQHVREALRVANYVYVMRRGKIVLEGSAAELKDRLDDVESSYLSTQVVGQA